MLWFSSSGVPQRRVSSEACWHSFQCSWKLSQVGLLWQFATRRSSHLTTWNTNFWDILKTKKVQGFCKRCWRMFLQQKPVFSNIPQFLLKLHRARWDEFPWSTPQQWRHDVVWCNHSLLRKQNYRCMVYPLVYKSPSISHLFYLRLFFFPGHFQTTFRGDKKISVFWSRPWGRGFWWHSPCMNTPSFSSALAMQSRGPPKDWTIGPWKFDFFKKFQGSSDPFKSWGFLLIYKGHFHTNQKMEFRNPGGLVWDPGDCSNGWRPNIALAWWTSMNISTQAG